jgi:hypothetical protein
MRLLKSDYTLVSGNAGLDINQYHLLPVALSEHLIMAYFSKVLETAAFRVGINSYMIR